MTSAPHFVVDAFTKERFKGNPAAVVLLESWPDDALLQRIAAENNLSETAFIVREGVSVKGPPLFRIRWLTPLNEVDLCGHATLAAAHVILDRLVSGAQSVSFESKSGPLSVARDGARLAMDFPSLAPDRVEDPALLERVGAALGIVPLEAWLARDLVVTYARAEDVRALEPNMALVRALAKFAVNPTAPGTGSDGDVDFVSRFFAPNEGVDEDPVTGSAHCTLAPLWAAKLGRSSMKARQVSPRGGELEVEARGKRVLLRGDAVLVVEGRVYLS